MTLDASRYPFLLAPWACGRLRLRNRIVHASMTTRRVVESVPTEAMLQYYENRAAGGAALIVTEPLNATRLQARAHYVTVTDRACGNWLRRWAERVEGRDCRLLGQFQDSGRGRHERGRNPKAIGVSALPDDLSWTMPRVLTIDEIQSMVEDFGRSAAWLEACGFSGVELSAGHGHLFHQFLSPWSNRREDAYGGDLDGRSRVVREIVAAIRANCSHGFLVSLKLPGDDGVVGGVDPPMAAAIAARLVATGDVDLVTFCQGAHARTLDWHIPDMHWPRAAWMPLIRQLRESVAGVPVMALGLITDPAEAEGILARGEADLIALGRPLVTDPAWPLKAAAGREHEIRYCVSCNSCWGQIVEGQPLQCDNNPRVALADEVDWRPPPALQRRHIVVVGAGVAGLEVAWIAAARGHDVTVFGASAHVGAATRLHARLPGGEALSSVYDYQYTQARRYGVRFELGVEASVGDIVAARPDEVVLATGASMLWPAMLPDEWRETGAIPDLRTLMTALVGRREHQGGTAVLFDMDHTEGTYAAAEMLARLFDRVVLLTPRDRIAADMPLVSNLGLQRRLSRLAVEVIPHAEPSAATDLEAGRVVHVNVYNGRAAVIEDVAVFAYSTPRSPRDQLVDGLRPAGIVARRVGDCFIPRTLMAATHEAHALGNRL